MSRPADKPRIRVLRGTTAQLGDLGTLNAGEFFFASDTDEVFIGTGTGNIRIYPDWDNMEYKARALGPGLPLKGVSTE